MLKTGAILNFLVAAGHLACLPWLYPVLSIYRIDGIMETLALRYGAAIPYLLTVAIAFIFAVFGLYGLSGAGIIRRLPLLETGIYTIATLFLLRAVAGVAEMAVTGCALLADSTEPLLPPSSARSTCWAGGVNSAGRNPNETQTSPAVYRRIQRTTK